MQRYSLSFQYADHTPTPDGDGSIPNGTAEPTLRVGTELLNFYNCCGGLISIDPRLTEAHLAMKTAASGHKLSRTAIALSSTGEEYVGDGVWKGDAITGSNLALIFALLKSTDTLIGVGLAETRLTVKQATLVAGMCEQKGLILFHSLGGRGTGEVNSMGETAGVGIILKRSAVQIDAVHGDDLNRWEGAAPACARPSASRTLAFMLHHNSRVSRL